MKKNFKSILFWGAVLFILIIAACPTLSTDEAKYQTCDATPYDKGSFLRFLNWSNQKEQNSKIILDLIGEKKKSFLDIGAGNGDTTKLLEDNFEHIFAIEPSKNLFQELQKTLKPETSTLINEKFENCEIKQKFDLILASHVFQYISNPIESITRIKSLLKQDGIFLLINNNKNCEFTKFYNRYQKSILGEKAPTGPTAFNYDFSKLLNQFFEFDTIHFAVTTKMPSANDVISIFDFLYDINSDEIQPSSLEQARIDLEKRYDKWPLIFNFECTMYVCKKQ